MDLKVKEDPMPTLHIALNTENSPECMVLLREWSLKKAVSPVGKIRLCLNPAGFPFSFWTLQLKILIAFLFIKIYHSSAAS